MSPGPKRRPLAERFWAKVDKNGPIVRPDLGACWLWTAGCNPVSGYGQVGAGGRGPMLLAHRVAYELVKGPIPPGLTLDHLCNMRHCVNPAHLDPCTIGINSSRAALRRSSCRSGHPLEGNVYIDPKSGSRRCRVCNTQRAREYRLRKRGRA